MSLKECPSCAMEIDSKASVCPVCAYEFPVINRLYIIVAVILLAVTLMYFIF